MTSIRSSGGEDNAANGHAIRCCRFATRMNQMPVSAIRELLKATEQPEIISFAGGLPAPELFPIAAITQAHDDVFSKDGFAALQYSSTEGHRPLREWIACRMRSRGIEAAADRVLITSGAQQGIDLVGKVFLDRGDAVVVESPCYLAALQAFSAYEAKFIAIDSDDDGLRVDQLEAAISKHHPKLIYLVADFSNPKGTTLSVKRRYKLVELSARYQVPILEDNPYGDLRYGGQPVDPLAALDESGLVIHLGSFSKTLSPGMRVGWLLASDPIFQTIVVAKQAADLHTCTVEQFAIARLLETFDFDAQVRALNVVYRERRDAMYRALEEYFPSNTRWTRPEGGLFLWVELPEHLDAEDLSEVAIRDRVAFVPGTSFFADRPKRNFMRLNFSNQKPALIEEGIRRVGDLLNRSLAIPTSILL